MLAFVPAGERELAAAGLSLGVMSATQGDYDAVQMLLDITQGTRIASTAYASVLAPRLAPAQAPGSGWRLDGWQAVVRRAQRAPQLLTPGLLAGSTGGGAYVGVAPGPLFDAVAAVDERGRIRSASLGTAATAPARVAAALGSYRLVVADLPGPTALAALLRLRRPGELVLAVQRVPPRQAAGRLLWVGAAGLPGGAHRQLTSATTRDRGLVAAIDLAPTALRWLRLPVPSAVRGRTIESEGVLDGSSLRALMARLRVIGGRRLRALGLLLAGWIALLLATARWPHARARAMRTGALAVLFSPLAAMVTAALQPGAALEYALLAGLCFACGALSDRLLVWPRALLAPGLAVPVAVTVDALAHTELLTRSLIGPDPILGARFYGVGNELKSGLAVLVLAALAVVLEARGRGRAAALTAAGAGAVLAAIEGSAQIGAGVGGVILVGAGFALTTALLLPGRLSRRRALIVVLTPIAALVALAALDLLTARGTGHFSGSVLHARSAGDVRDILVRRYEAAWGELRNHAMPVATALALAAALAAVRRRERLLAPVAGKAVWWAVLAGGLTAGVAGALVEDSGPLLLVVAALALGCVLSYLWGRPPANLATR